MSEAERGWQPAIANYADRPLAQRQQWYSPAAQTYARVRPGYPPAWVAEIAAIADLTADCRLLEVGCGPGLATTAFAQLGTAIVALEPNAEFAALAQAACAAQPRVEIRQLALEDWPLEPASFDAVLAATSWHWIPAAVSYPQAAAALKPGGRLILLWNKQLQPPPAVYQALKPAFERHAPHLFHYESAAAQVAAMQDLGQMALAAGSFGDLQAGYRWQTVTYSSDDYLALLATYSPYLTLAPALRAALLADLRAILRAVVGDRLSLTYLSAHQVLRVLS